MDGYRGIVPTKGRMELETFIVQEPTEDEIFIRTRKTLISPGTERAFFLGLPNTTSNYPIYPGYNLVGEVVQVGSEVTDYQPGERVVCQGQHASHVVMKAERCLHISSDLPDDEAIFFQLLAIATQGVRKSGLEIGEATAIIGAGPVGLLSLQVARLAGAMPLMVIDKEAQRLSKAGELGADITLTTGANLRKSIQDALGADGVPVVIEVTGDPEAIPVAFQIAALRGRVVLLGSARGETEHVNFYRDVHKKGLPIVGAHIDTTRMVTTSSPHWWTQRDEQRLALKMLTLGRVNVSSLVSHRFSGEQLPDAYALLASWDPRALAILIDWL